MVEHSLLIVDDEPVITMMISTKLTALGCKVHTARNGQEGLDLAIRHIPLVIVTDYEMPRLTGLQMAQQLKANPATAEIPVIMLTARGHRVQPSEMATTNIQHLTAKPFSAKELLSIVQDLMASEIARRGGAASQAA